MQFFDCVLYVEDAILTLFLDSFDIIMTDVRIWTVYLCERLDILVCVYL